MADRAVISGFLLKNTTIATYDLRRAIFLDEVAKQIAAATTPTISRLRLRGFS